MPIPKLIFFENLLRRAGWGEGRAEAELSKIESAPTLTKKMILDEELYLLNSLEANISCYKREHLRLEKNPWHSTQRATN